MNFQNILGKIYKFSLKRMIIIKILSAIKIRPLLGTTILEMGGRVLEHKLQTFKCKYL